MLIPIEPDDPRVVDYHNVRDGNLMRTSGLFVAEGRFVVERLLNDVRYAIRSLLLSEAACRALEPTLVKLSPRVPVYVCEAVHFRAIAGFAVHRGCLALAERPTALSPTEILASARTVVVLEDVANPDNVGGVFRNVAAFGADAVLLSPGCCDPLYRKAVRTSMATTLCVPFARLHAWPADLDGIRAEGLTVIALTPRRDSPTIEDVARRGRPARVALLVGSEGAGLSEGAMAVADLHVRIPISATVDSLNLAVATGIALARLSGDAPLW